MSTSPAPGLLSVLSAELAQYLPFAHMDAGAREFFVRHARAAYYAPDEVLLAPEQGVVQQLFFIRQGAVRSERHHADGSASAFRYEAGELFPVSAVLAQRPVSARYVAAQDCFVLVLDAPAVQALAQRCAVFADFLNQRIGSFLAQSQRALQAHYAQQALQQQTLLSPLASLIRRAPLGCTAQTPLSQALAHMQAERVGSILVLDTQQHALGILTRHDLLERVLLPQVPLATPIASVMVSPVHTLSADHSAEDAALLMLRYGLRHVPITNAQGAVIGLISERDLFALQSLSLQRLGAAIAAAADVTALAAVAQDIRRFAAQLLSQGVQARQLTALISHLNDVLTQRLLVLVAAQVGFRQQNFCWLALGSEGRSEQTIATDQDNALIVADAMSVAERAAAQAFAHQVNLALDACGYPLCKGGIMAGAAGGCRSLSEWRAHFLQWIEHGSPEDLLAASIYFDLRALAGDANMAAQLQATVLERAQNTPRFLKQLAQNALSRAAPLAWHGGVASDDHGRLDLKLQGTALVVDAARLFALAQGIAAVNTRERLLAVGQALGLASTEYQAWVAGFEFLQMLRLRVQLGEMGSLGPEANPNQIRVADLNDIDKRLLKESLRVARSLQQRLQLDYER